MMHNQAHMLMTWLLRINILTILMEWLLKRKIMLLKMMLYIFSPHVTVLVVPNPYLSFSNAVVHSLIVTMLVKVLLLIVSLLKREKCYEPTAIAPSPLEWIVQINY